MLKLAARIRLVQILPPWPGGRCLVAMVTGIVLRTSAVFGSYAGIARTLARAAIRRDLIRPILSLMGASGATLARYQCMGD